MTEQPVSGDDAAQEPSDAEGGRSAALPGTTGDSQYGNDSGFADAALGEDAGGTPEDQPG